MEARYHAKDVGTFLAKRFYAGRITWSHEDGSYDVDYDDGDAEWDVPLRFIRRKEEEEEEEVDEEEEGIDDDDEEEEMQLFTALGSRAALRAGVEPPPCIFREQVTAATSPNAPLPSRTNPSGFKGVYPGRGGRWQAQVDHKSIGGFLTAWEAGLAVTQELRRRGQTDGRTTPSKTDNSGRTDNSIKNRWNSSVKQLSRLRALDAVSKPWPRTRAVQPKGSQPAKEQAS